MKVLLVIDVQNGFLEGKDKLVDNISKLAEHFRENNDKVIAFKHIDEGAGSPIERVYQVQIYLKRFWTTQMHFWKNVIRFHSKRQTWIKF